jgi:divalent metal cation (Fe/Co/Zn/Cd) transporter
LGSTLASGFILFNAYLIFRPALGEIMDEHVHDDLIEKIRATSNQVEGIIDTENASSVKRMKYHVDLHAIVNAMITVKKDTI